MECLIAQINDLQGSSCKHFKVKKKIFIYNLSTRPERFCFSFSGEKLRNFLLVPFCKMKSEHPKNIFAENKKWASETQSFSSMKFHTVKIKKS